MLPGARNGDPRAAAQVSKEKRVVKYRAKKTMSVLVVRDKKDLDGWLVERWRYQRLQAYFGLSIFARGERET